MIEVQGLTHAYGSFKAVSDVSFKVEKGEVVGFLGPNGAGKTTTMKALAGFLVPLSGKLSLAAHDVLKERRAAQRTLGYLPEHCPLYSDMTVVRFLDYVARLRGLERDARRKQIDRAAERTGIRDVLLQPIGELSKGYRQRTGLASALVHDPEVLVLDEPMSGLDPNQVQGIRALVRDIGATKTVLFSTHVLSEVEATCRRAIVIRAGRIVADGPIADLKRDAAHGALRVRFRPGANELPSSEALVADLAKLSEAARVLPKAEGAFLLDPRATPDDLASQVFRYAADKGFSLVELAPIEASLEDVFLALTASGKGGAR
jgi:ABC-2 type transport system ATP-binding protein